MLTKHSITQDFFFRFPWNNFLHNVVYDVVQQVFNGTLDRGYNKIVAFDLFAAIESKEGESPEDLGLASTKDITDRILDGQRASDLSQKERGTRLGFMGHLTLIAEEVCKFGNRQPAESLDETVMERVNRDEWVQYVEGSLAETREKDNAVLGGVRPQDSIGARQLGIGGGGFTSNSANTLASAGMVPQDSLAMVGEGAATTNFTINSGTLASGFGDDEDDEEMEDEVVGAGEMSGVDRSAAFTEDDQVGELSIDYSDLDAR